MDNYILVRKNRGFWLVLLIFAAFWGCGGSGNRVVPVLIPAATPTPAPTATATATPTPTPVPTPVPLTNSSSSLVAIDCNRNLAYVGRALPNQLGNGNVEVLDLNVDPNVKNPHVASIDLGSAAIPTSLAWDANDSLIIVVAEQNDVDGSLYLIDEKTNTLLAGSPFTFPAGSSPGPTGGVVFDPIRDQALAATCDNDVNTCSQAVFDLFTGFTTFDIATKKFSPIIVGLPPTDSVTLNWNSRVAIGASDTLSGTTRALEALNTADSSLCTLGDSQLSLLADADDVAFDPSTNILVVGNFANPSFVVVNLNGSTFNHIPLQCTLNEGGTLPNSTLVTTDSNYVGVSVNPATHQAFMDDPGSEVALVSLPSAPIMQLTSANVSVQTSIVPDSPQGGPFIFQTFPYANTVDVCHNRGYVRGDDTLPPWEFLIQVDLAKFAANPSQINNPLGAGTCAGVVPPTLTSCSNGSGVVYFPLSPP